MHDDVFTELNYLTQSNFLCFNKNLIVILSTYFNFSMFTIRKAFLFVIRYYVNRSNNEVKLILFVTVFILYSYTFKVL